MKSWSGVCRCWGTPLLLLKSLRRHQPVLAAALLNMQLFPLSPHRMRLPLRWLRQLVLPASLLSLPKCLQPLQRRTLRVTMPPGPRVLFRHLLPRRHRKCHRPLLRRYRKHRHLPPLFSQLDRFPRRPKRFSRARQQRLPLRLTCPILLPCSAYGIRSPLRSGKLILRAVSCS